MAMLAFDFRLIGEPADDCAVCAINAQILFSLPLKFVHGDTPGKNDVMVTLSPGIIPVLTTQRGRPRRLRPRVQSIALRRRTKGRANHLSRPQPSGIVPAEKSNTIPAQP